VPDAPSPALRRTARGVATEGARGLLVLVAMFGALGLLGSCAGERPSLGAIAPSVPATTGSTSTTASTLPAPPRTPGVLGPGDLLGWIATPVGDPEVYAEPSTEAKRVEIGPKTEAGAPTTFAVVGDVSDPAKLPEPGWYEVALPTRPNGSTGWVPIDSVTVRKTDLRLFVDLEARTLRVERNGEGVFTAEIAIGTPENPTPVNGTYVTELIRNRDPEGSYGPYAYGLAMHSNTLTEFAGGDGQVGIHGTNRPALIGQAVSHGCVRLKNADVQELVDLQLPLGVPVFIT
jgi:lipoprotein-anchoring transpeptidase ErfK/SrfK